MDEQKPIALDMRQGFWIAPGGRVDMLWDPQTNCVVFQAMNAIPSGALAGSLIRGGQMAVDIVAFIGFFDAILGIAKSTKAHDSPALVSSIPEEHIHIEKMAAVRVDAPEDPTQAPPQEPPQAPAPLVIQREKVTRRVERDAQGNISRIVEE